MRHSGVWATPWCAVCDQVNSSRGWDTKDKMTSIVLCGVWEERVLRNEFVMYTRTGGERVVFAVARCGCSGVRVSRVRDGLP